MRLPRSLRPLVLAISIAAVIFLRLMPQIDPVAGMLQQFFTDDLPQTSENQQGPIVDNLNAEVERLRLQLKFNEQSPYELVGADIINKTTASFRESFRIGRGSDDGVKTNQAVISQDYLIGIVTSVEPKAATVLLVGDPDVKIPVTIGPAEGIVSSQAGGIVVDQVAGDAKPGQAVVTSGLGGVYPPGLVVGELGQEIVSGVFKRYQLLMPVRLSDLTYVMVVLER